MPRSTRYDKFGPPWAMIRGRSERSHERICGAYCRDPGFLCTSCRMEHFQQRPELHQSSSQRHFGCWPFPPTRIQFPQSETGTLVRIVFERQFAGMCHRSGKTLNRLKKPIRSFTERVTNNFEQLLEAPSDPPRGEPQSRKPLKTAESY